MDLNEIYGEPKESNLGMVLGFTFLAIVFGILVIKNLIQFGII